MATLNLLYRDGYSINDQIRMVIPTVEDVLCNEDEYFGMVSMLTAMPIDLMVQLYEAGIDFTKIGEWDLFLRLFGVLREKDTSLIFGDLDLREFVPSLEKECGDIILVNKKTGIRINRMIHGQISAFLRKIHNIEKNMRKPGNDEAKEYMLERAKKKANRNKCRLVDSQLENLIIAMVNTPEYSYNFEETKHLTIYQFNESVRQVIAKVNYDNRMHGVYSGTISAKDISQEDWNWLSRKK